MTEVKGAFTRDPEEPSKGSHVHISKYIYIYIYIYVCQGSSTRVNGSHSIPGRGASFFEYVKIFINIIRGLDHEGSIRVHFHVFEVFGP